MSLRISPFFYDNAYVEPIYGCYVTEGFQFLPHKPTVKAAAAVLWVAIIGELEAIGLGFVEIGRVIECCCIPTPISAPLPPS